MNLQVTWQQARQLAYATGQKMGSSQPENKLDLGQAVHHVLAHDLPALFAIPHYDSSAMDGFAVAGQSPWQIIGQPASPNTHQNIHSRTVPITPGQATPVLTGSLIPSGTEAVIRVEHTQELIEDGVTYLRALEAEPSAGQDIRYAGEEVAAGSILARAGSRLSPRLISMLAVAGYDQLPVRRPPRIALAFTGNEVITSGIPQAGQVRDAYSPAMPALITALGAQVTATTRLFDDLDQMREYFTDLDADTVLVTGGSSASAVDCLRLYLNEVKADYAFDSVQVRPGHPAILAQHPAGFTVFGLPGNPLAAYTSLYSLLPAFIAGFSGAALPTEWRAPANSSVAAFDRTSTRLIPATFTGQALTIHTRASRSHMLSSFAQANALAVVEPAGVAPGQEVSFLPLFN